MPRGSASKKTALASEQDRPDVARKRERWKAHQGGVDIQRLVFIDETWAKTNMTPLRGWAAMKVMVFQCPNGALPIRRLPRAAQPRSGVLLVLAQVSSMKTSR